MFLQYLQSIIQNQGISDSYNNMKYLLLLIVLALASSELIITEMEPKAPLTPPQEPIYPKHPEIDVTQPTVESTPSILPYPAVDPLPQISQEVVIGQMIPTEKLPYTQPSETQGFYNSQTQAPHPHAPKNGKQGKGKHAPRNQNNLRQFDQSLPNYYPYHGSESYNKNVEYQIQDEDVVAGLFFVFVGIIVLIAIAAACKKRKALNRARRMQRAAAQQANAQQGNVIENINAQIRYHQQESNRLRTALLEQEQRQQQEYQRRLQQQQRLQQLNQQNLNQYQRQPQYYQYAHQLPPPIVPARQLNQTQQPIRRGYPEDSQVNYNGNFNYPYPPAQVPYRPFRNQEQLSVIHNNNAAQSETFSDYPRL